MSNAATLLLHYLEVLKTGSDADWTLNAVRMYAAHIISRGL